MVQTASASKSEPQISFDTSFFANLALSKRVVTGWVATQIFLEFSPLLEVIEFDEHIFQRGWFNHQPNGVMYVMCTRCWA